MISRLVARIHVSSKSLLISRNKWGSRKVFTLKNAPLRRKLKIVRLVLNWFYNVKLLTPRNNIFEKIYFLDPLLFRLKIKFSFTDTFSTTLKLNHININKKKDAI